MDSNIEWSDLDDRTVMAYSLVTGANFLIIYQSALKHLFSVSY